MAASHHNARSSPLLRLPLEVIDEIVTCTFPIRIFEGPRPGETTQLLHTKRYALSRYCVSVQQLMRYGGLCVDLSPLLITCRFLRERFLHLYYKQLILPVQLTHLARKKIRLNKPAPYHFRLTLSLSIMRFIINTVRNRKIPVSLQKAFPSIEDLVIHIEPQRVEELGVSRENCTWDLLEPASRVEVRRQFKWWQEKCDWLVKSRINLSLIVWIGRTCCLYRDEPPEGQEETHLNICPVVWILQPQEKSLANQC